MWSIREKAWSFEARNSKDLEELVADWLSQQESTDWLPSIIVLGALLAAMILFGLSRLA